MMDIATITGSDFGKRISVRVSDNILNSKPDELTVSEFVRQKLNCQTVERDVSDNRQTIQTLLDFFDFIIPKIAESKNTKLIQDMAVYIREIKPEIDKAKELVKDE